MSENLPLLCLGTGLGFEKEIDPSEQLEAIKNAGFDACFYDRLKNADSGKSFAFAEKAAKLGLVFQSIHAPFYGMDDIWHDEDGELAAIMEKELLSSIDDCAETGVPIVIMHAIIGMDNCTPTELGIQRLEKVIDRAVKKGVNIAFENTEGEMYLEKIFDNYGRVENVGFCIDTGHEMCYNFSRDLIGKYGQYLIATHLNDNMGITNPPEITFLDDAHLLPFDGVADWNGIADRLNKCGYDGILTFELNAKGRKGNCPNRIYDNLSFERYVNEAYNRAVKFREIFVGGK